MSTRWYPIYQKGNPQLRIYLPNFWLKLVKPVDSLKKNVVLFHCSMEMTRHDVKNYLQQIYKVPVIKVDTRIGMGKTHKNQLGYVVKDDDIKMAFVHLPRDQTFEFPNLFKSEAQTQEKEKEKSTFDTAKKDHQDKMKKLNETAPGYSPWFNI